MGRYNKYRWWCPPPLGKKRQVLSIQQWPCYQTLFFACFASDPIVSVLRKHHWFQLRFSAVLRIFLSGRKAAVVLRNPQEVYALTAVNTVPSLSSGHIYDCKTAEDRCLNRISVKGVLRPVHTPYAQAARVRKAVSFAPVRTRTYGVCGKKHCVRGHFEAENTALRTLGLPRDNCSLSQFPLWKAAETNVNYIPVVIAGFCIYSLKCFPGGDTDSVYRPLVFFFLHSDAIVRCVERESPTVYLLIFSDLLFVVFDDLRLWWYSATSGSLSWWTVWKSFDPLFHSRQTRWPATVPSYGAVPTLMPMTRKTRNGHCAGRNATSAVCWLPRCVGMWEETSSIVDRGRIVASGLHVK